MYVTIICSTAWNNNNPKTFKRRDTLTGSSLPV